MKSILPISLVALFIACVAIGAIHAQLKQIADLKARVAKLEAQPAGKP